MSSHILACKKQSLTTQSSGEEDKRERKQVEAVLMNSGSEPPRETQLIFYKCTRWQVEETLDPFTCPYHYFCDSLYAGDYPPYVDILVLVFTAVSYLSALIVIVSNVLSRKDQTRRYLVPSGPISLPVFLLILAKGPRINDLFPVSTFGPMILTLVHVSALIFESKSEKDTRYMFYEASVVSGILHASLYLDATILPYYTGFDALVSSTFSGACDSCVCRKEALVVGGRIVSYRGWSATTFLVITTLCLRIFLRLWRDERRKRVEAVKTVVESLAWVLIVRDTVYLAVKLPGDQSSALRVCVFTALLVLIYLQLSIKACTVITRGLTTTSDK